MIDIELASGALLVTHPGLPTRDASPGGTTMPKAAVLREVNEPLDVVDLDLAVPGVGEVEVAIAASGICHSDLSVQRGVVGIPLPVVLGHEGSGVVTRVGQDVIGLAEGDHVVLSWVPSCGECVWCVRDEAFLCESGQRAADLGRLLDGGARLSERGIDVNQMSALGTFAERTVVPAQSAVPIPSDIPLELAALVGCGVLTGVGAATRTANIRRGDSVAVIGCGGVGLNVIQGARLAGAERIIAIDTSPAKLLLAGRFGATDTVNALETDVVDELKSLTSGRGVDVSFEVIGLQATIQQAIRATRRGGETVLVGIPDREATIPIKALAAVYGARTIKGCWYGSSLPHVDVPNILALHEQGKLELRALISGQIALSEVNRGLTDLAAGTATRSVIRFQSSD
jgi:S-(hydroxymethyl)glutathione dehydrogenase/alcohol dehydrogenase